MYLIVIAWMYVVLMMSVAEATNVTGTVLGAIITFVLYGLLPAALVAYLMSTPARNRAIKKRNADELARHVAGLQDPAAAPGAALDAPANPSSTPPSGAPTVAASDAPDAGGHSPGGPEAIADRPGSRVAPVRKEP